MESENINGGIGIYGIPFGIIGIILSCSAIGIVPSIIGLIISIVAIVKVDQKKGTAIVGLICSIIGILFFTLSTTLESSGSSENSVSGTNTEIVSSQDERESETELDAQPETLAYDKEILFRDIPWGTSCTEVEKIWGDLFNLAGDGYKTFSSDDIIIGDYEGIDFEYDDINIVSSDYYGEVDVAGYMTSNVRFYFVYVPVDGVLTREEKDSALYGARYEFEAKNLEEMSKDLIQKLTTMYGEPAKTTERTDFRDYKYTYTYWYGANDTVLVLKTQDVSNTSADASENQIYISYVWLKGDEMLQEASDISKQEALDKEAEAYGNDSTNGL